MVLKGFITSQFRHCPLVWMFHSRTLNNWINKIHERALKLVYQNNYLSFTDLLEQGNSASVHQGNLQVLVTKIFKLRKDRDHTALF